MNNLSVKKARIGLLAMLLVGVVGVTIRTILIPPSKEDKLPVVSVEFPQIVPLKKWQAKDFNLIKKSEGSEVAVYKYQNNQNTLKIQSSYRQYDGGNVSRLLFKEANIPPATVFIEGRYRDDIGNYGVFQYEDQAHLTTCINKAGKSTFTDQQYTQNKYKHGWSLKRTLLWTLGQKDLFETSCLWTLISIPVASNFEQTNLEPTYQTLETILLDWYRWWKPQL